MGDRSSMEVLRLRRHALDWVGIDDEVVVLDGERESYLGTNPAGALLWRELSIGASQNRLVQLLVDEFGIDHGTAAADTEAYLDALRERDLLDTP